MTTVQLPRMQSGPEPQRLLTTLLGDYWYWRDEHIPSSTLVSLLGEFGVSPDGARSAMKRLSARGLLTVSRSGRTTAYGIPERTSEVIISRTHSMLFFGSDTPRWDGLWTVVVFSVPEDAREMRTALRAGLRVLHFGALYDGVWVSPHDRVDAVARLLADLGVASATVFRSEENPTASSFLSSVSAFDLQALGAAYEAFAMRYEPLLRSAHGGTIGTSEALLARTNVRVDWRVFPETDPEMPVELLPADWPRARARRCFVEIYDLLGPLAELRFRQIVAASAPELAELVSHHTSASVARLYAEIDDRSLHGDTPFERAAAARLVEGFASDEGARSRPRSEKSAPRRPANHLT